MVEAVIKEKKKPRRVTYYDVGKTCLETLEIRCVIMHVYVERSI